MGVVIISLLPHCLTIGYAFTSYIRGIIASHSMVRLPMNVLFPRPMLGFQAGGLFLKRCYAPGGGGFPLLA